MLMREAFCCREELLDPWVHAGSRLVLLQRVLCLGKPRDDEWRIQAMLIQSREQPKKCIYHFFAHLLLYFYVQILCAEDYKLNRSILFLHSFVLTATFYCFNGL